MARSLRPRSFPLSNLQSRSRRGSGATVSVVAAATFTVIAWGSIGLLVAWVALGEIPRPAAVLGGLITMVGVAIVHWARPRAVPDGLELPEPL